MKTHFIKLTGLLISLYLCLNANAQNIKYNATELNNILKTSLYQSIVTIDDDGTINRKDNNGNTFVYSLKDIESVGYDFDGFHNVILTLKKGKTSKTVINGKSGETTLNVFAFDNQSNCDMTINQFKELIK